MAFTVLPVVGSGAAVSLLLVHFVGVPPRTGPQVIGLCAAGAMIAVLLYLIVTMGLWG